MGLEGKYVENGRCAICGKDWPHIHTLEEAFLYEARRFGSLMREQVYEVSHPDSASFRHGQEVGARQERSRRVEAVGAAFREGVLKERARIRRELLDAYESDLDLYGFLALVDRIVPPQEGEG